MNRLNDEILTKFLYNDERLSDAVIKLSNAVIILGNNNKILLEKIKGLESRIDHIEKSAKVDMENARYVDYQFK